MEVVVWCVILGILLPPLALAVSIVALASVPTDTYRRSVWRRLVRLFGVLSVGSAILAVLAILFVIGLKGLEGN